VKKSETDDSPYSAPAKRAHTGRPRKRGGRKKSATKAASSHSHRDLTSLPTTRNAQVATRAWLLKHYGPHCAYCGFKFPSREMTLDHVAPRRGQTAYDRRDNLVLACRPCNALKRDQAPLAFLLARKSRVPHLLKYGAHLSTGLLDLARPLVRKREPSNEPSNESTPASQPGRIRWGASDDDGPSPYRDA
jgi:5-methylcytosine-specific restriction endonuclease McrA